MKRIYNWWFVIVAGLAVALAIVWTSQRFNTPSHVDQIEKVDKTRAFTSSDWTSVQNKLRSNNPNDQIDGLSLVQATLVPEQVAYGREAAMRLKDSKNELVRVSAITTLYRLKTKDSISLVENVMENDSSPYVRGMMKGIINREKTKPLF
jgi:hypothetical protein